MSEEFGITRYKKIETITNEERKKDYKCGAKYMNGCEGGGVETYERARTKINS